MGRINKIYKPEYWKIELEGSSKIVENDIIYKMIIGEVKDCGLYKITEFISKINYENIINKKYKIEVFPYAILPVLLFDEEKRLIPLVSGLEIQIQELNSIQIQYLEKNCSNFKELIDSNTKTNEILNKKLIKK